jgi:hypothetical protein
MSFDEYDTAKKAKGVGDECGECGQKIGECTITCRCDYCQESNSISDDYDEESIDDTTETGNN